ncbi:hypothetical protein HanOQP8_Chr09g0340351 [Helianthus annuus]|nr:hypothetical protein HanOQP8_Chr09g0340351 [Helianthus annuus]
MMFVFRRIAQQICDSKLKFLEIGKTMLGFRNSSEFKSSPHISKDFNLVKLLWTEMWLTLFYHFTFIIFLLFFLYFSLVTGCLMI